MAPGSPKNYAVAHARHARPPDEAKQRSAAEPTGDASSHLASGGRMNQIRWAECAPHYHIEISSLHMTSSSLREWFNGHCRN